MTIQTKYNNVTIKQTNFINKIFKSFNIEQCNGNKTPMEEV